MLARFKAFDWIFISAVFALAVFGLLMVYSASYPAAINSGQPATAVVSRQLMFFVIGIVLFVVIMNFRYQFFKKLSPLIIIASLILLLLVPIIGLEDKGATRWISIGGFTLQPSEFVKLGVIIYLASVYSKKHKYINRFIQGVLPPLVIVVFLFTLILLQPDLGTAIVILMVTGIIIFLSGARLRHLIMLGALSLTSVGILITQEEYRMNRIFAFVDPFAHQDTHGHQLIQSYYAIANGGVTGTGFGQSVQKLGYLPEPHNDFILSIISEETGILGVGFVILCFLVIGFRGIVIGSRSKSVFGSLLAYGIVFMFMFQFIFNAGAVSGTLPITGITLPFVSAGGSSLIVSFVAAAIVANISRQNTKEQNQEHIEGMEDEEPTLTVVQNKKMGAK
ncbi:putative lipid II flippase FtsW [Geomicrobium sp. JCM 19038]|uniref:putative lipid II flippase FtsW n=1 Tax=Geomicrobium sp. JCM 19038 TaxID=1460635 RepID=UPI00045F2638|nr:putative lipid II flippase FtsW [Geomicrobium sp. JCM 19038]GAK10234.1 cell division protein FtsW [Geomicrobium sp. JCM 19038]